VTGGADKWGFGGGKPAAVTRRGTKSAKRTLAGKKEVEGNKTGQQASPRAQRTEVRGDARGGKQRGGPCH